MKTKRSKYGAVRTTVDGVTFHSQKEARRYGELKLLEKAGLIRGLVLQPRYELRAPVLTVGAALRRAARKLRKLPLTFETQKVGEYRGDFRYLESLSDGSERRVVEDVKGVKTPLYRWKKKHVEAQYGVVIREV